MGPKNEESLTGKTFEKCRIIAKLGTGGMGSVWLAEHFGLGRKVAVKILPPEMGRDPEYVARFMREATTAGRMEHPNIVQIHDVGYAEGRHFIVMQYVDGESLATVVENLGAMDPRDAAKIAAGMLRGLQHAHDEGVVHRDVKPDNVLIAKGDEPKLLDFGLAIETETALQITKDGMVVGTPYYLAPEQARGQKATPLCDVYAAGVTLYYLLTGKRPFVGATALAVLNKHIHEPPVPPMKHRPAIPKPLNDIVLKMMAKKPAERYQSAAAAADDLEAFLKGKQIQVKVPVHIQLPFGLALPPALAALSKNQLIAVAASAGGLFLLLIVLLIAAFTGGKPKPGPSASSSTPENPTKPPPPPKVDEAARYAAVFGFDKQNRESIDAFVEILNRYDVFIDSTSSAEYKTKAVNSRQSFLDYADKRADQEVNERVKEQDPYLRMKALQQFPKVLLQMTSVGKRLREEMAYAHTAADTRFLEDKKAMEAALDANRFKEARTLLEALLPVAEGPRKEELDRVQKDLPRREREFEDETLRRLNASYDKVHDLFADAMIKRETGTAFSIVAKFLKEQPGDPERQRTRVQGIGYDLLLRPCTEQKLDDEHMLFRNAVASAFNRAQNSLPFRILSDIQDAMDVEFLITEATRGLRTLQLSNGEVSLVTLGVRGQVGVGQFGFQLVPKTGAPKPLNHRLFKVQDLFQLAALAADQKPEELFAGSDQHCRAAGAAWVYTTAPERWAEAGKYFMSAEKNGSPGLRFRIESIRDRGAKDVVDRILASKKELLNRKFDAAKQMLVAVEAAWSYDPGLTEEIGRAMASILVTEVIHHERNRDYAKLKQAVRLLRTKYPKLYPEEVVFAPYAHALKETGDWRPAGSLLSSSDWTWEGKAQGAECPAEQDNQVSRGIKLKPGAALRLLPAVTRGASGAIVSFSLAQASPEFSIGFRFGVSDADGTYRKLVIRDTGEIALYSFDGKQEIKAARESLDRKLGPGQWVDLRFVAEGGDLVAYVGQQPVLLTSAVMAPDRAFEIWSSVPAFFRGLNLRH
jgi:serine/threonine-protein kinase